MKKALLVGCFHKMYERRLKPIRELLIRNGYEVEVLLSDFDHITKKKVIERDSTCKYIKVPKYKKNLSSKRLISHLSFGKSVKRYLEKFEPNLIYLLVPPNNTSYYCMKYKEKHRNTIFLMDIIDLWPESMPISEIRWSYPYKKWKRWRDKGIQIADYVFTECNYYQRILFPGGSDAKVYTLYLYKKQTEEEKKRVYDNIIKQEINEVGQDKIIRFAFVGSMNNILDIESIKGVITRCIDCGYKTELHAIGGGSSRQTFEEQIQNIGCDTFFYGFVFEEKEKIERLVKCDYALNMMKETSQVGLTIKSIDYLSYGLPLINNIKGDTWEMINENQIGINIESLQDFSVDKDVCNKYEILDFFESHFSEEAYLSRISKLFKEIN